MTDPAQSIPRARPRQLWLPLRSLGTPGSAPALVSRYPDCSQPFVRRLIERCPEALGLGYTSPVLTLALALEFPDDSTRDLADLLRQRQVLIAEACGFAPATPSLVRFLARIPVSLATPDNVEGFRRAWRDPWMRRALRHLPRLNFGVTYLLRHRDLRPLLTGRLLVQVARTESPHLWSFVESLHDYRDCLRRDLLPARPLASPRSPAARLARMPRCPANPDLPLPPPPLPAGDGIAPLAQSEALIEEGRIQRSCAGRLDVQRQVLDGEAYLYRVTHPARATLLLRRHPHEPWHVAQLRGADNTDVPTEVQQHVARWLASQPVATPENG